MCNDVKNILDKDLEPKMGKGIGYFITCPDKSVKKDIFSSKFIISKNFDYIYEELNKKYINYLNLTDQGLALKKRNNTYNKSLQKYFIQSENSTNLSQGFETLSYYNDVLLALESLGVCEYARNSIYFIEENFCYKNIQAQQNGFIYYTLSAFGVLLVAIGLNKISVFTDLDLKVFIIYFIFIIFFISFSFIYFLYFFRIIILL